MLKMISVVIPLYNKATYIEKCINSILNQSFSDFEIVVIDDGSTDNGADIVRQIKDPRIKLISQKNAGVSVARNRGVSEAKNHYVAFLDADDYWNNLFLQSMVDLIKKYPNAGMYSCKYKQIINNKIIDIPIQLDNDFQDGYIDYIQCVLENSHSPVWSSAVIVNREKFQQVGGFNPNLTCGEDLEFWLRMAVNFRTAYLNKPLAYYNIDRDESGELMSKQHPSKEQFFIFNLDYFLPFEKEDKHLKKLLDIKRLQNLSTYYIKDMYSKEVKSILKSIEYFPMKFKLFYKSPRILVKLLYSFCAKFL